MEAPGWGWKAGTWDLFEGMTVGDGGGFRHGHDKMEARAWVVRRMWESGNGAIVVEWWESGHDVFGVDGCGFVLRCYALLADE